MIWMLTIAGALALDPMPLPNPLPGAKAVEVGDVAIVYGPAVCMPTPQWWDYETARLAVPRYRVRLAEAEAARDDANERTLDCAEAAKHERLVYAETVRDVEAAYKDHGKKQFRRGVGIGAAVPAVVAAVGVGAYLAVK